MGNLSLAFKVLFNSQLAGQVRDLLNAGPADDTAKLPEPEPAPAPKPPEKRNDAISLLSTLQREARLVDFLMEPLDDYSDAQVGAAVRDVQRDSRSVVERMFGLQSVIDQEEGSTVEVAADTDTGCVRRVGDGNLDAATSGTLAHHGWQASKCELPTWNGAEAARMVVAPAEVEITK